MRYMLNPLPFGRFVLVAVLAGWAAPALSLGQWLNDRQMESPSDMAQPTDGASRDAVTVGSELQTDTPFDPSVFSTPILGQPEPLFAEATPPQTGVEPDVTSTSRPVTLPISRAKAATQPEASSAASGNFPAPGGSFGLAEFASHFAPHEPMYFIGGWQSPNIKFQFSFRYRILTTSGPLATQYPLVKGFNLAYSQTSLWDSSKPSAPFFDSSYRPEFFYFLENFPGLTLPQAWQLGFQAGVGHESNGQAGTDSRSLNIAYIRPIVTISDQPSGLFVTFAPKIYGYITSLSDNPDIAQYRGYSDLGLVVGQRDGLQLATIGRLGTGYRRGSAQFDLTYPLTKILHGNADLSVDAQYFVGYGDSLLNYNQRSSIFRIGICLVR